MPDQLKLLKLTARRGENGERRSELGVIIAMLASDNENTRSIAALKLTDTLKSADADIHDLIAYIEEPPLNDRQVVQIQQAIDEKAAAIAETKKKAESVSQARFSDFHNTDGTDDWREMALFIDREKNRLSPRDYNDWAREFIDDMATRARIDPSYEASPRQLVQLRKFFVKLGGKVT